MADQVRLAELCAATSLFIDLGMGQPDEHGMRTCLIAMRLAGALDLDEQARRELFYVSLLRFLGCTADAHQLAGLAGGDEVQFLAGMATVAMGSPREELGKLIRIVATGQPLPRRLRALARALTSSKSGEALLEAHCEVGARLATQLGLPPGVSAALAVAYARWDGKGVPAGIAGEAIPLSVRVSIAARDIEVWGRETDSDTTRLVLERRRAHAYDPAVVDAALDTGIDALRSETELLWDMLLDAEPQPRQHLSGESLMRALAALGDYADLKWPERSGYARRITRLAAGAARHAGLDEKQQECLVRAALVHDVGMVAVPVDVCRARPSPGSAGWEQVRLHPHWSARVLSRCGALREEALIAGRHHERLDGSGYPFGISGDAGRPSGLLAAVVAFDEMRPAVASERQASVESAMHQEFAALAQRGSLHSADIAAVLTAAGIESQAPDSQRPAGLTEREVEVLRLLALGHTNREIAGLLGIRPKTAGAHIEHIYAKAGVRSRAAATLFAMQHDLLS